ncbi:hypothetical protein BDR03DRAFT_952823, partial [Suillus americanus]
MPHDIGFGIHFMGALLLLSIVVQLHHLLRLQVNLTRTRKTNAERKLVDGIGFLF